MKVLKWDPGLVGERFTPSCRRPRHGTVPNVRCCGDGPCSQGCASPGRKCSPTKEAAPSGRNPFGVPDSDADSELSIRLPVGCESHILDHLRCRCSACMKFACKWRLGIMKNFRECSQQQKRHSPTAEESCQQQQQHQQQPQQPCRCPKRSLPPPPPPPSCTHQKTRSPRHQPGFRTSPLIDYLRSPRVSQKRCGEYYAGLGSPARRSPSSAGHREVWEEEGRPYDGFDKVAMDGTMDQSRLGNKRGAETRERLCPYLADCKSEERIRCTREVWEEEGRHNDGFDKVAMDGTMDHSRLGNKRDAETRERLCPYLADCKSEERIRCTRRLRPTRAVTPATHGNSARSSRPSERGQGEKLFSRDQQWYQELCKKNEKPQRECTTGQEFYSSPLSVDRFGSSDDPRRGCELSEKRQASNCSSDTDINYEYHTECWKKDCGMPAPIDRDSQTLLRDIRHRDSQTLLGDIRASGCVSFVDLGRKLRPGFLKNCLGSYLHVDTEPRPFNLGCLRECYSPFSHAPSGLRYSCPEVFSLDSYEVNGATSPALSIQDDEDHANCLHQYEDPRVERILSNDCCGVAATKDDLCQHAQNIPYTEIPHTSSENCEVEKFQRKSEKPSRDNFYRRTLTDVQEEDSYTSGYMRQNGDLPLLSHRSPCKVKDNAVNGGAEDPWLGCDAHPEDKMDFRHIDERRKSDFRHTDERRKLDFRHIDESRTSDFRHIDESRTSDFRHIDERRKSDFRHIEKRRKSDDAENCFEIPFLFDSWYDKAKRILDGVKVIGDQEACSETRSGECADKTRALAYQKPKCDDSDEIFYSARTNLSSDTKANPVSSVHAASRDPRDDSLRDVGSSLFTVSHSDAGCRKPPPSSPIRGKNSEASRIKNRNPVDKPDEPVKINFSLESRATKDIPRGYDFLKTGSENKIRNDAGLREDRKEQDEKKDQKREERFRAKIDHLVPDHVADTANVKSFATTPRSTFPAQKSPRSFRDSMHDEKYAVRPRFISFNDDTDFKTVPKTDISEYSPSNENGAQSASISGRRISPPSQHEASTSMLSSKRALREPAARLEDDCFRRHGGLMSDCTRERQDNARTRAMRLTQKTLDMKESAAQPASLLGKHDSPPSLHEASTSLLPTKRALCEPAVRSEDEWFRRHDNLMGDCTRERHDNARTRAMRLTQHSSDLKEPAQPAPLSGRNDSLPSLHEASTSLLPTKRALREPAVRSEDEWFRRHASLMSDCTRERQDNARTRAMRLTQKTVDLKESVSDIRVDLDKVEKQLDKVRTLQQGFIHRANTAVRLLQSKRSSASPKDCSSPMRSASPVLRETVLPSRRYLGLKRVLVEDEPSNASSDDTCCTYLSKVTHGLRGLVSRTRVNRNHRELDELYSYFLSKDVEGDAGSEKGGYRRARSERRCRSAHERGRRDKVKRESRATHGERGKSYARSRVKKVDRFSKEHYKDRAGRSGFKLSEKCAQKKTGERADKCTMTREVHQSGYETDEESDRETNDKHSHHRVTRKPEETYAKRRDDRAAEFRKEGDDASPLRNRKMYDWRNRTSLSSDLYAVRDRKLSDNSAKFCTATANSQRESHRGKCNSALDRTYTISNDSA